MGDTIHSMTGYASARAEKGAVAATCDMRSVNGKSLDIRLRYPAGLDSLEPRLRKMVGDALQRGNVQVSVTLEQIGASSATRIDDDAFRRIARDAARLSKECGLQPPTADGILAARGVVLTSETAEAAFDPAEATVVVEESVRDALTALISMRQSEGAAMDQVLRAHLAGIRACVASAATDPDNQPDAIFTRLKTAVDALLGGKTEALDPARLHAEAALLATKADVREEIDRLLAHVAAAETLLDQGGAVGKKLDFLAQEFNRETNTICSKSASAALTSVGLDLKARIDQFREQVQNLQ